MNYVEFSATIEPVEHGRDILIAELSELGFESFVETEGGVNAYIVESEYPSSIEAELSILSNKEFKTEFSINKIENQNWNKTWEDNFQPINVGDSCIVRADFHEKSNVKYDIVINPQMSFGTGHHETTYLMIEALLGMKVEDKSLLDMGCGTGVLAILASKLNAENVVAIDIDDWAYENTVENVRNNNCSNIITKKGGAELLIDDKYDIVLANINRNILLNDMDKYVHSLNHEGSLLLSGFFSYDVDVLMEKALTLNLNLKERVSKNDWTLLHLVKE